MKNCTKCKRTKGFSEFCRNKSRPDGHADWCKECDKEYRNRPDVAARKKEYKRQYRKRPEVKEKLKEYMRSYRKKPEFRQYYSEYHKRYTSDPKVKTRKKEYAKNYRNSIVGRAKRKKWDMSPNGKLSRHKKIKSGINHLSDTYLKKLIRDSGLKNVDIPKEMVLVKRCQMLIYRGINILKEETNGTIGS